MKIIIWFIDQNCLKNQLASIQSSLFWLESSQNRGVAQKGLFFLLFDPLNRFYQQFWYRKVFLLYWLCLSKQYIAKNAMCHGDVDCNGLY